MSTCSTLAINVFRPFLVNGNYCLGLIESPPFGFGPYTKLKWFKLGHNTSVVIKFKGSGFIGLQNTKEYCTDTGSI